MMDKHIKQEKLTIFMTIDRKSCGVDGSRKESADDGKIQVKPLQDVIILEGDETAGPVRWAELQVVPAADQLYCQRSSQDTSATRE